MLNATATIILFSCVVLLALALILWGFMASRVEPLLSGAAVLVLALLVASMALASPSVL
ncbi:hypothetical protein ACQKGC_05725 [Allorhizobium pseudoryzae]|uniref:hypothetical protein n=1 Tax=Allorhizobium pseudoryzae TaxID=379684 RepID=UPI003CFF7D63